MFQSIQKSSSGYQLVDLGTGSWQIRTPKGIFTGNLRQVCTYSVLELGFTFKELEIGVIEMEKHFHNAAEFGIFKSFMWSYDLNEKDPKYGTKH